MAVDEVVAEQHGEGLLPTCSLATRTACPGSLTLADEGTLPRSADSRTRKAVLVAPGLERGLELPVAVEVVLEGHLVAP